MATKIKYYIVIPAYNEESSIPQCLWSINKAVEFIRGKYTLESTYICVNGCTDDTEKVIRGLQRILLNLRISVLKSKKGMNRALNKIVQNLTLGSAHIIKVDADTEVSEKSFKVLLDELHKNNKLQIVGGHPRAKEYNGKSLYKKILASILDVRSHYPMSQVAAEDVSEFHKLAELDPQPTITPEFERKSRIYFHGRFYVLNNKEVWNVPPERIGDDTYLTLDVYNKFGLDAIRIRYDATCYYQPSTSITMHWKVYKRIFCDTYSLFKLPEFCNLKHLIGKETVKLDWDYINTLPIKNRFYFLLYSLIKTINSILFKLTPKEYNDKLWTYKSKVD